MDFSVIPKPRTIKPSGGKARADLPVIFYDDPSIEREGYRIAVTNDDVKVRSSDDSGRFYAERTLFMMKDTLGYYPTGEISDAPKNRWRAVMLDTGRYFFPLEDVKALIDDASKLKFNVLYLHLSEDQGWRAEILSRPRLAEVGSSRRTTNGFPCRSEGFYTQSDLKEIVRYAHKKQMIVVPEIDVPGHVRAALAAYPELACFPKKFTVATHFGVKHDILCAGKEETYRFLYDVFAELCAIFNDGYFGLGGDEAVKMRWKLCPDCQRAMKENGFKEEDQLQTYFMNRLNREFFKPRGIRPSVWVHGAAPAGLDREFVLLHYGGENVLSAMKNSAEDGFEVVNADSAYFYLDFPHALTPVSKVYAGGAATEPFRNLLGGMVSLWSEYIPRMKTLEKRAFPRILAAAEALWTNYDKKEYNGFVERALMYYAVFSTGRHFTPIECAEPAGFKSLIERLWWARRPLHWEGAGNLLRDLRVARQSKKPCRK